MFGYDHAWLKTTIKFSTSLASVVHAIMTAKWNGPIYYAIKIQVKLAYYF